MTVPTRALYAYEQSSESGRERHLLVPQTRLKDTGPTLGDPACVTSLIVGMEVCGTVITVNATNDTAVVNVAEGAIYIHYVYNLEDWDSDGSIVAAAYAAINVGDPVFYDQEADTLGHGKLTIAQYLADNATPKPRFGTVVMLQDESASDFPKPAEGAAADYYLCAILQTGLNNSY